MRAAPSPFHAGLCCLPCLPDMSCLCPSPAELHSSVSPKSLATVPAAVSCKLLHRDPAISLKLHVQEEAALIQHSTAASKRPPCALPSQGAASAASSTCLLCLPNACCSLCVLQSHVGLIAGAHAAGSARLGASGQSALQRTGGCSAGSNQTGGSSPSASPQEGSPNVCFT